MPKISVLKNVTLTQKQFEYQIKGLAERLDVRALEFESKTAERAYTVFRNSFKYQHFYSAGGQKWAQLSDTTIKKRKRKHTWHRYNNILNEYGTLKKSIEIYNDRKDPNDTIMMGTHKLKRRVFTNPKSFNVSTNPHQGFCYAGVHNNPYGDTYGTKFGAKPAIQRQFMGYSTYIDKFMEKNIDKYLFDKLFGNVDMNDVGVNIENLIDE